MKIFTLETFQILQDFHESMGYDIDSYLESGFDTEELELECLKRILAFDDEMTVIICQIRKILYFNGNVPKVFKLKTK